MPSHIITCACGSKVRLPDGERSRSFRCPRCKQPLALASEVTVLASQPVSASRATVCSICQTDIEGDAQCVACPGCDQVHHRECWSEVGGCGTYGCSEAPAAEPSESSASEPLTAWGDTKKCPACGEEIKSIALRCRYCATDFSSVDPMSATDLRAQAKTHSELKNLRKGVVACFVLSLIGCFAPLMAIVSAAYLLPQRERLKKCGPLFAIMGWTSVILSTLYTLLILIFFLVAET